MQAVLEPQDHAAPRGDYFRPRRIGHVNLLVSDVDRSMDFYRQVAGLDEAYRRPKVMAGFLTNGNSHHDVGMIDVRGPLARGRTEPALNHLAFELETEVDLVDGYGRATADGVRFHHTADHDIAHAVYGRDPDGNMYEIYADVVQEWWRVRSGVVNKPKPDWTPGSTPPCAERRYQVDPPLRRVEEAAFHPLRTTHATLVVDDLEASFAYYTGVVGLKPVVGDARSRFAILGGTLGERNLALFRAREGRPACFHHFGLQLRDEADLDEGLRRLAGSGIEPEAQVDHPLRRSIFLRDPDGFRLQLYVDRPGDFGRLLEAPEELALFVA